MCSRRPALALLALLAAASPVAARAAMPVAVYPLRVPGLSPAQRSDLQSLLEAALISAARRGVLAPRSPPTVPATCGEAPTPACLATAARDGLLLTGRGEIRGGVILVAAALWDRNGNHTRESRFVVDLVIQNLRPVNEAIAEMEIEIEPDGTVAGGAKAPQPAPAVAATGVPPPPPARGGAPAVAGAAAVAAPLAALGRATGSTVVPAPAPGASPAGATAAGASATATGAGALAAKPVAAPPPPPPAPKAAPKPTAIAATPKPAPIDAKPVDVSAPAPKPAVWKRQAGPLFTFLGAGLVAAGGVVAFQNRALARDLEEKYSAGSLQPSDKASYDRVQQNNLVTAVLVGGGAVAIGAGTYLWITAPPAGSRGAVAMAGAGGTF